MNATGNIYKPQNEDPSDDSSVENRSQRSVSHTPFSRLQNLAIHSFPEPVQLERITAPRRSRSRSQVAAEKGRRRLLADYYADLFNESVDEISLGICYDDTYHSLPSQVGVVSWTVEEKDVFFKALSRYGKGATPKIASTIGTKCELEVRALTELLEKRLSYRLIREPRSRLLTLADIPAAYEISDECCRALEECADALLAEEQDKEKQVYRRKDRDYWLVDYNVAASVEEVMRDNSSDSDKHEDENIENNNLPKKISSESHGENENRPEESNDNNGEGHTGGGDTATKDTNSVKGRAESSIFTTAKLLHISNWVRLSERIFMNAGQKSPENNWTRIAGENESPSLTSDSFAGFYALTISITRRLVQSSIFFALSRIRSVRQVGYGVQDVLRKEDVTAALDVLKMKRDSHDFWAQAARRCKLDVQDIRHIKGWKPVPLSYNVIEDQLSGDSPLPDEMNEAGVSELDVATTDTVHESCDHLEESSSDNLEPTHKSPSLADGSFDQLSDPEEAEAEDVDKNASSVEERQLWIEIKRQPSHLPSVLDEPQVRAKAGNNERHALSRKTKQDIVDWRGRLLYHSEWEQFGPQTPLVEREILENRRKRRRLG